MPHEEIPPLCAELLFELDRQAKATPVTALPKHLQDLDVLNGTEYLGLAERVFWKKSPSGGREPFTCGGSVGGIIPPDSDLTLTGPPECPVVHYWLTHKGRVWVRDWRLWDKSRGMRSDHEATGRVDAEDGTHVSVR